MKQRTNQFGWKSANPSPATFCPSAKVPKGEGACNGTSNEPASEGTTTTSSNDVKEQQIEDEPAKPKEKKKYIGEKRKKKFTGHSRTDFALKVYDKAESAKEACSLVVHDIFDNKLLCDAMHAAGWEPNQRGYTDTQYRLLRRFYRMKKGAPS